MSDSTNQSVEEPVGKRLSKRRSELKGSKRVVKKTSPPPQRKERPTRYSGRIQAANIETTKRPNYNEEEDTENDASDTE